MPRKERNLKKKAKALGVTIEDLKAQIPKKPKSPPVTSPQNTEKDQRINRPMGLTAVMQRYHQTKDQKLLNLAQKHIIQEYINTGLMLNGIPVSLDYLSIYLRMPKDKILKQMTEGTRELIGDNNEAHRVLLSLAINGLLRDRGLIQKQVQDLTKAQEALGQKTHGYVAFLSRDLNQALKNLLDSNKPFIDLVKGLQPQTPAANVQINNMNQQNTVPSEKVITINEAIRLIDAKNPTTLLEDADAQQLLLEAHIQDANLPQVIATKQQGSILQGDTTSVTRPSKKRRNDHTLRREEQGDIVDAILIP